MNTARETGAIIEFIEAEIRNLVETRYTDYVMFTCIDNGPDVAVVWSPNGAAARRGRAAKDHGTEDTEVAREYGEVQRFRFHNVAAARYARGAVDLAIEVLWPDMGDPELYRREKEYEQLGVRESWIVDPQLERVFVTDYETGSMKAYTLEDRVPIGIFHGEAAVDFGMMRG